ncbi:hypothetical protein EVAR_3326_1 [Eumeta japonica]|uniref:Uncharacterized protein n=1 Tax=Eumeta variegata TaxID=151549 RepID=A0A4C1SXW7_EUMVA|nr:hypothetical protein EVAR_3326_1 [Eumeta japonica]
MFSTASVQCTEHRSRANACATQAARWRVTEAVAARPTSYIGAPPSALRSRFFLCIQKYRRNPGPDFWRRRLSAAAAGALIPAASQRPSRPREIYTDSLTMAELTRVFPIMIDNANSPRLHVERPSLGAGANRVTLKAKSHASVKLVPPRAQSAVNRN